MGYSKRRDLKRRKPVERSCVWRSGSPVYRGSAPESGPFFRGRIIGSMSKLNRKELAFSLVGRAMISNFRLVVPSVINVVENVPISSPQATCAPGRHKVVISRPCLHS